jgi:monofunctional glycosyltransferase
MARRKRTRYRALIRLALAATAALLAFCAWKALTWPDVAALAGRNPESTAFIERWRDARRAQGKPDRPDRRWVPYAVISPNLKRAVLVSEDINFFSHHGFEVHEMKEAVKDAVEERELPRGASTITQQVAKNLWLSPSRNPMRKIEEAILTWQLERDLDKRRILEIYLNVAEFGDGIYGAEAAARRYFGKAAADLGEEEAAQLAACLPNPRLWHPGSVSRVARRRTALILERMGRAEFLWKDI